LLADVRTDDA